MNRFCMSSQAGVIVLFATFDTHQGVQAMSCIYLTHHFVSGVPKNQIGGAISNAIFNIFNSSGRAKRISMKAPSNGRSQSFIPNPGPQKYLVEHLYGVYFIQTIIHHE